MFFFLDIVHTMHIVDISNTRERKNKRAANNGTSSF